jgi:hypothetical protein
VSIRIRHLAASIALVVAACGAAFGGQSPDPVPRGTLTLGPLRITPTFTIKDMGFDDNVFNTPVDPKRDFTFTATPRADVLFRMRRLRLSYITATDYVYYRTYPEERGANSSSSARLDVDLGRLKPYVTAAGVNSKARLNGEVDARKRHREVLYGAGLALKIASRTNLLLNATQGEVAYDPGAAFRGVDLRDSFNGRRRSIDAGIGVALTPLTTLTIAVAREFQTFERSPERNSNAWRVTPTFLFNSTGVLTGSASLGYRRFHTVSPALPDYSGLVSTASILATLYARNHLQAVFTRDVQYSYDLTTDYYISTGGTMTWTLDLAGPFDVRAMGGRTLMDYRTLGPQPGTDTTTTYGGGVGFHVSSRARLGVNVDWSRRVSQRSTDRNFRNHRIFAGLNWGT